MISLKDVLISGVTSVEQKLECMTKMKYTISLMLLLVIHKLSHKCYRSCQTVTNAVNVMNKLS